MLQVHRKQELSSEEFPEDKFQHHGHRALDEALKEGSKSLGPKMSFTEKSTHQGS